MTLDTFSVHVVRTPRSFSSVTSCMFQSVLMNRVARFVLVPPVHNFALVWVELQLPVSRPDTEGVKIFLEISSNFYISYMSPYFSIISRYWFLSSPAGH